MISRQKIAQYAAVQLTKGNKKVMQEVAAYLITTRTTDQADLLVRDIELYLSRTGHLLAHVGTVSELTAETKKTITALLQKETGAKDVELVEYKDPELIGGVKIDIPGKQLDTSVARTLAPLIN